jgi:molybdopterin-guanine dinucleotide biosynthesis protein A
LTHNSATKGNGMEEEKEEKVRLNIYVARSIMEELQKIKKETGRSLLDLVREALWRYVKFYNEEFENGTKKE